MNQLTLFPLADRSLGEGSAYPEGPGARQADTSVAAAEAIAPRVENIRADVLKAITRNGAYGLTADEAAMVLGLTPFTTRPRCTELKALGFIKDSGGRRVNASGKRAIVWVAA